MDLITSRSRELLDSKGPLSHGFYTSGQLMLEEYYTLSVIGEDCDKRRSPSSGGS